MPSRFLLRTLTLSLGFTLLLMCAPAARAQDEDFGDDAPDPIKLFRQGQKAHAKGVETKSKEEVETALEFYDQALKINPDFAEAEYQRAVALAMLGRAAEAETGLRRAMELSPEWLLPPAALGEILARTKGREGEAEAPLRQALKIDPRHAPALLTLAELRRRAGDAHEALELLRRATSEGDGAPAHVWAARGELEKAAGDSASALKSFGHALRHDPKNVLARYGRAEILVGNKDFERALKDLQALEEPARSDASLALAVATLYARVDDKTAARRVLDSLPEAARRSPDVGRLRASLDVVNCENTPEARAALEKLLVAEPKNASVAACLGELYRTEDPQRSLAFYRQAAEVEPANVKYATGYASALVQLRRFAEAAELLRRVIAAAPDSYAAHSNYAIALYELKLYRQAIGEYNWMAKARPDLAVIYFFIGTAHDHVGEYEDALRAYEAFMARADASVNQLEMDKVNLRLPTLRKQIKRGEGVRKKG